MFSRSNELQLSLIKLTNVTAQRLFRKPYLSLSVKQKRAVDGSLVELFAWATSMATEIFESRRQVGFARVRRKSSGPKS